MTAARPARRWRIYAFEARYQFLSVLREPGFAIPTLLFPLIFYLFFGVVMGAGSFSAATPTYMLATYSVFGIMGPSLFGFGAGLAIERDSGVLLLKRTTPMPAAAYLLAKVAMAITFGAAVVLGIFLLGAYGAGVVLYRWQWFALAGVVLAGVIPFCALGLAVGAWSKGRAAVAITNLVFLPMAMLSGLWIPITIFPAVLQDTANVFPAYHQAQLALKIIAMDGGQATLLHVSVLGVQSVALLAVAAFGFRRAGTGTVSIRPGGMS